MPNTYSPGSGDPRDQVRLLINDVAAPWVFADEEIDDFLALEGDAVKLAAAQAIDSQATNEALALKVLKDHQISTDGAKLADAMRKHAANLRAQHEATTEGEGYFEVVDFDYGTLPELSQWAP